MRIELTTFPIAIGMLCPLSYNFQNRAVDEN